MKKVKLPFLEHIGAVIEDLDQGIAVLSIDIKDYHLQHLGYVHGGVISSLADNTGWYAVISNLPEDKTSAKEGKLKAIGRVLKLGKSVAFATVELYSNDDLVAYATGTYAILTI